MDVAMQDNDRHSTVIERVDSGATDESPFGSSLTTPVDEDVILFHGLEQRLRAKSGIDALGSSESGLHLAKGDFIVSPKLQPFSNVALESQEISEVILESTVLSDLGSFTPLPVVCAPSDSQSNGADRLSEGGDRSRSSSIYLLPNHPIDVTESQSGAEEKLLLDTLTQSATSGNEIHREDISLSALPFADTDIPLLDGTACFTPLEIDSLYTQLPSITRKNLAPTIMRIVIFLPWCVAVGGAILLCPKYLDFVAFGPGYVETPRGIRRLAYWADSGMQHVGIFLGFLVTLVLLLPAFGILLAGGVVAQFLYAWHDFVVDPSVPLGVDNRQTMYIVATQFGLSGTTNFSKKENGYFLSWLEKEDVIVSDSDEEEL